MAPLDYLEIGPEQADHAVIWLHGLGDSGHGFADLPQMLPLPSELSIRFVLPHAPERAVTINNGMRMPAWYDIAAMDFERHVDQEAVRQSAAQVAELIRQQIARGMVAQRIVLGGFSQGGAVAYQCGLTLPQRLAGIVALSSYLALPEVLDEVPQGNAELPIFVGHGTADPVVPFALGEQSVHQLRQAGFAPDFRAYPSLPHALCAEELNDLGVWMSRFISQRTG